MWQIRSLLQLLLRQQQVLRTVQCVVKLQLLILAQAALLAAGLLQMRLPLLFLLQGLVSQQQHQQQHFQCWKAGVAA
jgi:hypothetical protein